MHAHPTVIRGGPSQKGTAFWPGPSGKGATTEQQSSMFVTQSDLERKSWSSQQAYQYCEEIARKHYENFPVGSMILPRSKRPHLHAVYAFARTGDDFADEPGRTPAERIDLLNHWDQQLTEAYGGKPTHPVFIALADTVAARNIPIELLRRLLTAFKMDVTKSRYESFEEVLHYCRHSANPVGELVLLTFDIRDPALVRLSDSICTALQLTNFWQDVWVDAARNRIYVPQEDLRRFGCTVEELRSAINSQNLRSLLQFQVHRTRQLFVEGAGLVALLDGRLKFEVKLTWLGGWRVLEKIDAANYDVLQHRPTISLLDKALLIVRGLTLKKPFE